jgi:hypothetical protein
MHAPMQLRFSQLGKGTLYKLRQAANEMIEDGIELNQ